MKSLCMFLLILYSICIFSPMSFSQSSCVWTLLQMGWMGFLMDFLLYYQFWCYFFAAYRLISFTIVAKLIGFIIIITAITEFLICVKIVFIFAYLTIENKLIMWLMEACIIHDNLTHFNVTVRCALICYDYFVVLMPIF